MILTLEDLEKWFNDLNKLIFDINVSIDSIKRIKSTTNEYEKQILNHGFFFHFYLQSRFTIIVQLCKIFANKNNNNQKRNINKLFSRLTSDEYDEKLLATFAKNKGNYRLFKCREDIIAELNLLKVEIEEQNELINKILKLRDKYYAHSDPDADIPSISDTELELLIKLAIKIYNSLRSGLLDTTFMFERNNDWSVDYPLKILGLYRKEQLNKIKII